MKNSSKINICVITDAWQPVWGGGQEHIWQVYKSLAKIGSYTITILAPNLGPKTEIYFAGRLKVLRLGPKFTFPSILGRIAFLLSVFHHELTHDYDLYHSHASDAILLPFVKFFKPKAKFAYTVHGAGVNLLHAGILNSLKIPQKLWSRLVYSYSWDLLFTAAKSTITKPIQAKLFHVIGNGVNLSDFKAENTKASKTKFTLIWVGRLTDPVKGFSFMENAYEILSTSDATYHLKVITNVPHPEVIKALKASDLFVLSSLSEGLPLVLLEAMAAKLPVVVTSVGDCKELVESANSGLVVPPGNSAALAAAINKLRFSPKLRSLGENGFTYVKNHYTWPKVAAIYTKYYAELQPS